MDTSFVDAGAIYDDNDITYRPEMNISLEMFLAMAGLQLKN